MDRKKTLEKKLKEFKMRTLRQFPIQKMYLFGSRAWGKPHRDSDVDLIVVSPRFKTLNFFQRGARMYDFWNLRYPVDFLCYTPEEFEQLKKKITIVSEAVKRGKEI